MCSCQLRLMTARNLCIPVCLTFGVRTLPTLCERACVQNMPVWTLQYGEMHTLPTGLGHEEAGCERAGDVILVVSQEPHALFRRCGDDLLHEVCSCACVC